MPGNIHIRDCRDEDAAALAEIVNHFIVHSAASFRDEPVDAAFFVRRMRAVAALGYPFLVAEQGGEVIGYAHLFTFRDGACYRLAEISIYLAPAAHGQGAGHRLYRELFERIKPLTASGALSGIMAIITADNEGSIRFHEKHGFRAAGLWKNAGFKFGAFHDVVALQWLPEEI